MIGPVIRLISHSTGQMGWSSSISKYTEYKSLNIKFNNFKIQY